jgi:ASC-1-like (ASCH) protein
MADLHLPLKAVYFDAIKAGTKPREFRLCTPFWRKRLEGKTFDRVVLTKGYPPAADQSRRLVLPWRGYEVHTITHEHFGPEPVEVFAINVDTTCKT